MLADLVKVDRYIRTVRDGKLVVHRPGDRITPEEAARLGLVAAAPHTAKTFSGARLPAAWKTGVGT